jgi:hypothetical protein
VRILRSLVGKAFPALTHFPSVPGVDESNDILAEKLSRGDVFAAGRNGDTEHSVVVQYLLRRATLKLWPYTKGVCKIPKITSGIYPVTPEGLDDFAATYVKAMASCDYLMIWDRPRDFERAISRSQNPQIAPLSRHAQTPFMASRPWSEHLQAKRVLVVHPFKESILKQYQEKRELLFADSRVLPKFDLTVFECLQTHGDNVPTYPTWSDSLRWMQDQIAKLDFDVALLSGGSYGLPLTAFVKDTLKKPAIHLAGSLQLLFGIYGNRWMKDSRYNVYFNEHWTRASESERPVGYQKIEDACYY